MRPIQCRAELYAHAIAIEREAAARYREFAERMADEGRDELASVFSTLAHEEAQHLAALRRRIKGVMLPRIAKSDYRWLEAGAPQTPARELVYRLMTPRVALGIALLAEHRAQEFFGRLCAKRNKPAVRALAKEMLSEEKKHASIVERLLSSTPKPANSTVLFAQPGRAQRRAGKGGRPPV